MRVSGGHIVGTKSPATAVRRYLGVKARDQTTAVAGYLMMGVPTRCSRRDKSCGKLSDGGSTRAVAGYLVM
jgi:hypothetical protein